MSIFKKIMAKLTGIEGPRPGESGVDNFNRNFGKGPAELAEERRQAQLRRMAEQRKQAEEVDITEDLEKSGDESNPN